MATTKSSSKRSTTKKKTTAKAKTVTASAKKTTKSTRVKAVKTTRTAKKSKSNRLALTFKALTTKSTKSKPVATPAAKKSSISQNEMLKKLNSWNWMLALIYAVGGIGLIVASEAAYRAVTLTYVTEDTLAGADETILVSATRTLFDVNIVYLVAGVLFVAAVAHLLRARARRASYEQGLKSGEGRYRWIDFGISGALIVATVALLAGVSSVASLGIIFLAAFVGSMNWRAMELLNKNSSKVNWTGLCAAITAAAIPWVLIGASVYGGVRYSDSGLPSYLYWLAGSVLVLSILHVVVEKMHYKQKGSLADYMHAEFTHMIVGFVLRIVFVAQIYQQLLQE